jgi:N-acetylglucosamine-6-phosphate deacetylase
VQVNGYGGQEFCSLELTAASVVRIADTLASFGVARFCPTITTAGFDELAHAAGTIAAACRSSAELDRRVLGIHLEGPYISPHDGPRGAHPLRWVRPPDWQEFCRLQEAAEGRIKLVTLSPEYDAAPELIARLAASGIVAAIGHTAATSEQIRRAVDAGATLSTHLGNGAHLTLPRHPNYLWDQLADERLWASLIVDGHHLPPAVVKAFVRAKSPERIVLISDLSGLAGQPPGRYASGLCDVEILDDGRLVVAGQRELLAAASRPIGVGVVNVMRFAGVDLATAVDMASRHPLRLLGHGGGELAVGEAADLVVFDLELGDDGQPERLHVRQTLAAGESLLAE